MHFIACPPVTSETGASRPKSLAGAIIMVYPQKYKNCSTLVCHQLHSNQCRTEKKPVHDGTHMHSMLLP
jgi:hypothetical protein